MTLKKPDPAAVPAGCAHSAASPRPTIASIALIAAFPALSPLSIDIAQPAMPIVTTALGATPMQAGFTFSLFMAGFGLAQLLAGPGSDRVGRKRPLVLGCLLYTFAGLGCALAPDIGTLVAMRALQGFGAGTCVVLAFAIVRDRYEGAAVRICLSYVNAAMWVAPIVAPSFGIALLALDGWRLIYVALGATGIMLLAVSLFGFKETLRTPNRGLTLSQVWRDYARVLGHRVAVAHAVLVGLSFGGMFAYVAGSSWVFLGYLHLTPTSFAAIFAAVASGLTTGSLICGRLAARGAGGRAVTSAGVSGMFATSAILLSLVGLGWFTLVAATPLLFLNAAAMGLAMPGAVQGALQPFPTIAGTASAVQGFMRMMGAAAASALVAVLDDGTPLAMSLVMTVFSGLGAAVWAFAMRGRERAPNPSFG